MRTRGRRPLPRCRRASLLLEQRFEAQRPHLAVTQLTSWRETATAIAAGLGSQPIEWLGEDDDSVVERP